MNAAGFLLGIGYAVKEETHARRRIAQRRNTSADCQVIKVGIIAKH